MKSKVNQLLTNKKIMIVSLTVLLALIVGIVILVTSNTKEVGNKDSNAKTEQSNEDTVIKDNDKTDTDDKDNNNSGGGLEVLKPNEGTLENSSNASGSWDDSSGDTSQIGGSTTTDKTDNQTQNNNQNGEDKEDDNEASEKHEDILEDDIDWGNIY